MKRLVFLKWLLPTSLLIAAGLVLIAYAASREVRLAQVYATHTAAAAAFEAGDLKTAYTLYLASSYEFEDPKLKAICLYEAATAGWIGGFADYNTLVGLYKQSLRYSPGFDEAALNLEYLYWLKTNAPEQLPQPDPGTNPGREEEIPSGDV